VFGEYINMETNIYFSVKGYLIMEEKVLDRKENED